MIRACSVHVGWVLLAPLCAWAQQGWLTPEEVKPPAGWDKRVPTAGQAVPVPSTWLRSEEARIAHSLKPPAIAPQPLPFDFRQPWWERLWPGAHRRAAIRYFDHLCRTEAGQWIARTVPHVEGLYFARPRGLDPTTSRQMADPYGPENPWMERVFMLRSDSLQDNGEWFVSPPFDNYRYVEQPHRDVPWQQGITQPFVRLFGYTRKAIPVPGVHGIAYDRRAWYSWEDDTPMQVQGVTQRQSRYGYTWRGIKREHDREHGIAGGEVLIYDLQTLEVLAIRRQFLISLGNRRNGEPAAWEVAARCPEPRAGPGGGEFTDFAKEVLQQLVDQPNKRQ